MEIEKEAKIFIPLLNSKAKLEEFSDFRYVLGESILHNYSEKSVGNLEFKISNFREIIENPLKSPSNLVINEPFKMVTELEHLKESKVKLIFDLTPYEKQDLKNLKKMELEGKVRIGLCYLPRFENVSKNDKEISLILNRKRVLKKIEHEAFDGDLCFSGLGVLKISDLMDSGTFEAMMFNGIKDFSEKYACPIVIDLEEKSHQSEVIEWLRSNIEDKLKGKTLLINFGFNFTTESKFLGEDGIVEIKKLSDFSIRKLLKLGFKVQIRILELIRIGFSVENISKFLVELMIFKERNSSSETNYIDSVVLTPGIQYKTDMKEYGGPGFSIINDIYEEIGVCESEKKKLFKENLLGIFKWWVLKEKSTPKGKQLKCTTCGFTGYDESKWFSKNGLFFEKPDCFKKYLNFLKEKGL